MINARASLVIQENVPLSALSTFSIGGRARYYTVASSPDGCVGAIRWALREQIPYVLFAGGSNVVFPDDGLPGLVIRIQDGEIHMQEQSMRADAGIPLRSVIADALERGWKGLESLSGIPGTVGGAVVGNAGAYGHSIAEVVDRVEAWDNGKTIILSNAECKFSYRNSIFKEKPFVVMRVHLRFRKGNTAELSRLSDEIIKKREAKYKPGIKCPGSFFKNILVSSLDQERIALIDKSKIIEGKIPAGYLLDTVQARGMSVGGIRIADFHGNLFINSGTGTAHDVKQLAEMLKEKVREKFGIILEEEIRYL